MKEILIVVPAYCNEFEELEIIAWKQLRSTLDNYPICFVIPQKYQEIYADRFKNRVEFFGDEFFLSTKAYSQLLLSTEFYQRFQSYEYILIHQLDAFVFSDRLVYFCSLGYDYIGAPLPRWANGWHELKTRVGNGGLSLRRTQAMLRILREKGHLLRDHPMAEEFLRYEDLFFSYCGTLPDGLRVPPVSVALQFSVENDVGHCYKKIDEGGDLPFGCHAWARANYPFWRKRIEKCGYSLPSEKGRQDAITYRKTTLQRYLMKRMARPCHHVRAARAVRSVLSDNGYAIWGYGQDGKALLKLLRSVKVQIECIIDSNDQEQFMLDEAFVHKPDIEILRQYRGKILIGSWGNENEIADILGKLGFCKGKDFWKFSDLRKKICSYYYDLHTDDGAGGIERSGDALFWVEQVFGGRI